MIPAALTQYLAIAYAKDVMGRRADPMRIIDANKDDPTFVQAMKDELARIRVLTGASTNLAARDFVSYRQGQALEAALRHLGLEV